MLFPHQLSQVVKQTLQTKNQYMDDKPCQKKHNTDCIKSVMSLLALKKDKNLMALIKMSLILGIPWLLIYYCNTVFRLDLQYIFEFF